MGIVKLPRLRDYWSDRKAVVGFSHMSQFMPRAKFEAILRHLHFSNNNDNDGSDKLFKIRPVLESINQQSEAAFIPGKNVAIDESLVPFRGRINFRQYIPLKKHKFGLKLFKLCSEGGYTHKMIIYAGKVSKTEGFVAQHIVMDLMQNYLKKGRCLFTDNWYSSFPLAERLLQNETDFVGTFRKNRRGFPKIILKQKLKKGEMMALQKNRIIVSKWQDKRRYFPVRGTPNFFCWI